MKDKYSVKRGNVYHLATGKQQPRDPNLINAEIAMKRAAVKARELARISGTAIVTIQNGIIVEDYPDCAD